MPWQLISFDLDGTLVDSADEIAHAANRTLQAHGLRCRPVAEVTNLIGEGSRALMMQLLARAYLAQPSVAACLHTDEVLEHFDTMLGEAAGTRAKPYPGARLALAQLRHAGLRLACTTNKEARHAHRLLQACGLDDLFELVIGGDTLPHKKPHASVLRHVAAQLGVPLEAVVHVGDSRIDVEAARHAGVAAWAVTHGYNAGVPVAECRPDRLFDNLLDVAAHALAGHAQAAQPTPDPTPHPTPSPL